MISYRIGLLIAFASTAQAQAQTSHCTGSGSMVHCNTMGGNGGMSMTDCMITGNTATCNTIVSNSNTTTVNDSGASAAEGILALFRGSSERKFRKKLGAFLAEGDCRGAANFAYTEGKIEIGNSIAQNCSASQPSVGYGVGDQTLAELKAYIDKGDCKGAVSRAYQLGKVSLGDAILERCKQGVTQTSQVTAPNAVGGVQAELQSLAASIETPAKFDDDTTLSKVEVIGTQLLHTATVSPRVTAISDAAKSRITKAYCAWNYATSLMREGASFRFLYIDQSKQPIGSVLVARAECGL